MLYQSGKAQGSTQKVCGSNSRVLVFFLFLSSVMCPASPQGDAALLFPLKKCMPSPAAWGKKSLVSAVWDLKECKSLSGIKYQDTVQ